MKWSAKGHEYDIAYRAMAAKKKFYLFGAGKDGRVVYSAIKKIWGDTLPIAGFIDNDPAKQGGKYLGLPVLSPTDDACLCKEAGIVISTGLVGANKIEAQLATYGLIQEQDFYHYYVFLGVMAAYDKNMLYMPSISFLPGTKCNLRCRACLNFTPYIKKFVDRDIDKLKEEVDLFFRVVDYISLYHVSGGEPLLYSHIATLLAYIADNYGDKIGDIRTVTNGTVIPPDDFLGVLKTRKISVTLDDYRDALPEKRDVYEQVVAKFTAAGVMDKIIPNKFDTWIDLSPDKTDNMLLTDTEMQRYFDSCRVPWQEYRDGKLYLCNYADYAAIAGIGPKLTAEEYFDLREFKPERLKELMEFRLGYSDKGYVSFCRHCAGYEDINPYSVVPAEQVR